MKITIYELLGLIKDGKAPQKIKYEYLIYELTSEKNDYYCKNEMRWFTNEINSLGVLYDEVEIIEEPKKIEKLLMDMNSKTKGNMTADYDDYTIGNVAEHNFDVIHKKINELIDEINNLKEK